MVVDDRMLRKKCWPKTLRLTGDVSYQNCEELHNLYYSPNIIGTIKLRKRSAMDVPHTAGEEKCMQDTGWKA